MKRGPVLQFEAPPMHRPAQRLDRIDINHFPSVGESLENVQHIASKWVREAIDRDLGPLKDSPLGDFDPRNPACRVQGMAVDQPVNYCDHGAKKGIIALSCSQCGEDMILEEEGGIAIYYCPGCNNTLYLNDDDTIVKPMRGISCG